jgi:uncharacterized protein involved in exopolysaccharide biosynthesis
MISNGHADRPLIIEIIRIVLKNKKIITILVAIAAILGMIFTTPFFIPPVYKSETIIYPPSANASGGNSFGSETEIDDAVQILHSTILRDSIVSKYKLLRHYNIDTTNPRKNYYLNLAFNENIKSDQSRYNSIVISVYDTDPILASEIANDMVKIGDAVKTEIIRKNQRKAYSNVARELNGKIIRINQLGDSINTLLHKNYNDAISLERNKYNSQNGAVNDIRNSIVKIRSDEGIYDMDKQYSTIYACYIKANTLFLMDSGIVSEMKSNFKSNDTALLKKQAELSGARVLTKRLKEKLDQLNKSSKKYSSLTDSYDNEKDILKELKLQYEKTASSYEKEFPNLTLETLKNKYAAEQVLFNNLKSRYEVAFANLVDQMPASYVVSPAEIPVKKDFPNRILISALSALGIFSLCIVYFLVADYLKTYSAVLNT